MIFLRKRTKIILLAFLALILLNIGIIGAIQEKYEQHRDSVEFIIHIAGGMVFAEIVNLKKFTKNPLRWFIILAIAGIGWEAMEILIVNIIGVENIYRYIFSETLANKISDLAFNAIGLAIGYVLQHKRIGDEN